MAPAAPLAEAPAEPVSAPLDAPAVASATPAPWLSAYRWLVAHGVHLWVFVVLGAALRIRQWWYDRSLWSDEAAVAMQFIHDSYGRLAHPLEGNQGAPWGWLWLERLSTQVVGTSERSLRLVPLISAILALVFAALIAKRLLRPLPGAIAVAIIAVVEPLVYYGNDVKQYSTDAAAVAGVLLVMLVVLDRGCRGWWLALWSASSAIAVLCSQPAIFAVAISSAIVAIQTWRRFGFLRGVYVAAAAIPWIGVFETEYYVDLRNLRANVQLQTFWEKQFPPKGANSGAVFSWLGHALVGLTSNPVGLPVAWLVITLFVVGLVRLAIRQSAAAIFVLLLVGGACVAAVLRIFPLGNRLALYLVVPIVLTMCAAAGPRRTKERRAFRLATVLRWFEVAFSLGAAAALIVITTAPLDAAAHAAKHPYLTVESRPAIQYIMSHAMPGQAIYVEGYDMEAATYYHSTLGFPVTGSFRFLPGAHCTSEPAIRLLHGTRWVWLLFGYPPRVTRSRFDTIRDNLLRLRKLGPIVVRYVGPGHGVSAVLVDTSIKVRATTGEVFGGCVAASRVQGLG